MKQFGNPVSAAILGVIIGLVGLGGTFMFLSSGWFSWIGLAMVVAGASIWFAGEKSLKMDPPTAGLLHFWNQPIEIYGKPVSVRGKTLIADWFPIYISLVECDMSNHDKDFPVAVQSKEGTNLEGRISITYYANEDDLVDFVSAGNSFTEIDVQIDDIVTSVLKSEAAKRPKTELMTDTREVAKIIWQTLEKGSDHDGEASKSFGITIKKVQVILSPSKEVKTAMDSPTIEEYQRDAEKSEYTTNLQAAQTLQKAYAADPHRVGAVPSLETCLQQVLTQRLIRDGKASEIKGAGRIFGVVGTSTTTGTTTP